MSLDLQLFTILTIQERAELPGVLIFYRTQQFIFI